MITIMAKRRAKTETRNRHPQFPLRLPRDMRASLDELAERNARSATEEARTAIREALERAGLWHRSNVRGT